MPHPSNRLNTLRVVRHETKAFEVVVKDQDGRPLKLGGASMFMSIGEPGGAPIVSKSLDNGIEITDANGGKAEVTLSTVDTAALTVGTHKYDLWAELPGDPPTRYPVVRLADIEVSAGVTSFA